MFVVALSDTVLAALIAAFASLAAALISRPGHGTARHGVEEPDVRRRTRASDAARRVAGALFHLPWRLVSRLPPIERERNPLLAATLGFAFGGLGPALYFRTQADVLIGLVLLAPLAFAGGDLSGGSGEHTTGPSLPGWIWGFMALSSVYSFMRAHSSNRRLAQAGARSPLTQEERHALLMRKLRELAANGWSVESRGASQAILVRACPTTGCT